MLSMGQAAKLADVSKATLSRAIKSGKVSATKNNDGCWEFDPAEICRVYPAAKVAPEAEDTAAVVARAEGELAGLKAQLQQICAHLHGTRDLREVA